MVGQILTIARNAFVESVRQPVYFIIVALCAMLQLFATWIAAFSMGYGDTSEVSGDNKLLLDIGLATVFVCGMLLAAFIATAVISREIEQKTVLTVVSKPVPRPVVVLGKYLGVAAAILIATGTMLLFLQMGIRHGVMSTAADTLDGPVVTFTLAAITVAFAVGLWCNFFYGWVFTQTATLLLFPLMLVAWIGVLMVSKKWQFQPLLTDFKPQITIASFCVVMATLLFSAIATAASARLGQVMTIVICCGIFLFGLLSNYFIGRHVFDNDFVGRVQQAQPIRPNHESLREPGDEYLIVMAAAARYEVEVGTPVYYGRSPDGSDIEAIYPGEGAQGIPATDWLINDIDPAIVISSLDASISKEMRLQHVGGHGSLGIRRPPEVGDYLFTTPTQTNYAAAGLWGMVPNVQFFWLVDAVTQNQRIPFSHIWLVVIYGFAQIGVFLSLAVVLFQRREVG